MAVVLDNAVDWEGRVVLELTAGVVHVILQRVLMQEEHHWPVQGTAVIQADLVLEVHYPAVFQWQVLVCPD